LAAAINRRQAPWLALLLLSTGWTAWTACSTPPPKRPNVVLILVDTLRRDHVGAYGYERDTTPFIDSLAGEGILFEDAVAQAPWTSASMASLWTSRYPSEVGGVVRPGDDGLRNLGKTPLLRLNESAPTLAALLSRAGYRTIAVVSNGYAGAPVGLLRGFESVLERPLAAGPLTDAAIGVLEAEGDSAPFFLYLHYRDAHEPTDPPEPYRTLFPSDDGSPHKPEHTRWLHGDAEDPDTPEVRAFRSHKLALYDGALRYIDDQVRRIAAHLAEAGLRDETIFVIASDHGEEFWEHARIGRALHVDPRGISGIGHGHTLFGELLDVPLVMSGAGLPARRIPTQVRNLDLAPTLLGLTRTPSEGLELRGIDLIAAMASGELMPLPAISEDIAYGAGARSIEDGRHKLVRYESTRDTRRELLFDRVRDPTEQRDRLAELPEVARRLREALGVQPPVGVPTGAAPVELSETEREELRALGYLD
jgi:arylsulfatase A-like enzyme